jgi:hypothetical protein
MKFLFGIITLLVGIGLIIAGLQLINDREEGVGGVIFIVGAIVGFTGFRVLKK